MPPSAETDTFLTEYIADIVGASAVVAAERVQSLWSGYGEIRRYNLSGVSQESGEKDATLSSIIVKDMNPPDQVRHPRGWNTTVSNQRKLDSYEVESAWYRNHAAKLDSSCRVARCFGTLTKGNRRIIVMEDLDAVFPRRLPEPGTALSLAQIESCLVWLARFHARFLHVQQEDLWSTGTYWYLATRPDEYAVMEEGKLKDAAVALDQKLSACPYQTLVHGDAKIANFCFADPMMDLSSGMAVNSASGRVAESPGDTNVEPVSEVEVAAVDFQYVGGGVGIRDVAYFLGSCMSEQELMRHDKAMLEFYRGALITAINQLDSSQPAEAIAATWVDLYATAWTDFYRFLAAGCPTTRKYTGIQKSLQRKCWQNSDCHYAIANAAGKGFSKVERLRFAWPYVPHPVSLPCR